MIHRAKKTARCLIKIAVSENGSAFRVAACCATTDAEACFGISLDISLGASLVPASVMVALPENGGCEYTIMTNVPRDTKVR
jgi:hypothetical protein